MKLIDADALGVGRCSKDILPDAYCAGWNGLIELIEKAPTIDAVPVVRCKDCKHHEDEKIGMVYCRNKFCGWVWKNWFCADGELKEGADNG